jgi:hypothetical protein
MQVNGKEKDVSFSFIKKKSYKIFNNICINKIVQLADIGVQSDSNIYIALCQNTITNGIYSFIKANGGRTKLKNLVILNYEHNQINYYAKLVGIINLVVIAKIIFILITEKLYEHKN